MIRTLSKYIKEYKKASIITPVFMILEVIMEMMVPYLMASLVDDGIEKGSMRHILLVGFFMLIAAGIGLFAGLMGGRYGARASTGFARNLREGMYCNIQNFAFSNIDKYSTAGLVTRLTTDVTNVQNAYQMLLRMCMRAPASMIFAMIISFTINAKLACIFLGAVIILAFVLFMLIRFATGYFKKAFPKYDELNESVQENVNAIRVVKSYVKEEAENEKFRKASGNIYKLFIKAENVLVFNNPAMMTAVYTCMLLISFLGAKLIVNTNGTELSVGNLTSLISYCMNILMSLMMFSMVFVMISMSVSSMERIAEVLEEKADIVNPDNPVMEVKDGGIEFKNVSFSYNKESGENVLEDINLSIKPGETIGIIGGTGSSKSSLVNLISRLYDVNDGNVTVGGVDVKDYDLETLRNAVSVVLQKNVLFSGTIIENLRWGNKDAGIEECKRACRLSCADEFIERLPDKYNTYIEQGGSNVSGGQRQRLCIARALMKNPKVLILDDSTSAVDTATDGRIREAFAREIPDITRIIIAQRIRSVCDADRIIVMDEGRIDGIGTHDELLASNRIYREVYESQTGGSGDFDEKNNL